MKQELICIVCPKGCHLTAEQTAFCQELIEEIWKEGDTV